MMCKQASSEFAHPDCYAAQLGGCSTQLSNEHFVSEAVLRLVSRGERSVLVRNLTFQPLETQQPMGIARLASKVLCSKHNEDLSQFDAAGAYLFDAMDRMDAALYRPKGILVHGSSKRIQFNWTIGGVGQHLEDRWLDPGSLDIPRKGALIDRVTER